MSAQRNQSPPQESPAGQKTRSPYSVVAGTLHPPPQKKKRKKKWSESEISTELQFQGSMVSVDFVNLSSSRRRTSTALHLLHRLQASDTPKPPPPSQHSKLQGARVKSTTSKAHVRDQLTNSPNFIFVQSCLGWARTGRCLRGTPWRWGRGRNACHHGPRCDRPPREHRYGAWTCSRSGSPTPN